MEKREQLLSICTTPVKDLPEGHRFKEAIVSEVLNAYQSARDSIIGYLDREGVMTGPYDLQQRDQIAAGVSKVEMRTYALPNGYVAVVSTWDLSDSDIPRTRNNVPVTMAVLSHVSEHLDVLGHKISSKVSDRDILGMRWINLKRGGSQNE